MDKLKATNQALGKLPPAPSADPVSDIMTKLNDFRRSLDEVIRGTNQQLVFEINLLNRKFVRDLRATSLKFVVHDKSSTISLPKGAYHNTTVLYFIQDVHQTR